jgi:hypothetical protein
VTVLADNIRPLKRIVTGWEVNESPIPPIATRREAIKTDWDPTTTCWPDVPTQCIPESGQSGGKAMNQFANSFLNNDVETGK